MSTPQPASPHTRILLVEEDETTRLFLEVNLSADGYRVHAAADRDQALARLRTASVDLILVDVNGQTLGLIDWVRGADPALCAVACDTPVIVLTSHPDEVHRVRLLERGGDDVVAKPFSYPELCAPGSMRCCAAPRRASLGRCSSPGRCAWTLTTAR
jgi:DNA-binding response OmpR family regulator